MKKMTYEELIEENRRLKEQLEAVGAGGVSRLMDCGKDAEIARLREALQLMLDKAHPAYVEDSFFQRRLIEARETARAALNQQEKV